MSTPLVRVEGGAQLRELSIRLRAAGELELRKNMLRNIRAATTPAKGAVRQAELSQLPHGGGLNTWVASGRITTRIYLGVRTSGVVVRQTKPGKSNRNLRRMDRGTVRHPVFGDRQRWVEQQIPAGWWSDTLRRFEPAAAGAALKAMYETAREAGFH